MVEGGEGLGFALETLQALGVRGQLGPVETHAPLRGE
jgi:hypothetical protein